MATGRDPSATDDMLPGTLVAGRFRIVRELGRGGMARVLEAEDLVNGRRIALKLLKADIEHHGEAMERFRREGEFLLSLRHPAIVGVELSGQLPDGRLYLVMELLRGETLGARMKRGRMDPDELSPILAGAAVGLSAAHRAGVVHRDLKPDNVYLAQNLGDRSLQVKLLDFGISKIDGRATLTRTGQVLGTPRYMAPEQLAAERDLDGRTDVYALGVILYEALAGVPPFPATNPSDLIVSILHGKVVPLRAHRPELPAELEAVVMRAMARSREARYGTATELAEAWFEVTHQKSAKSPMARADMKTNLLGGMGMVTGASSVAGPSGEIPFRPGTFREFEAHRTALGVPLSGGGAPPEQAPAYPRSDKATAPAIALSPPLGYAAQPAAPAQAPIAVAPPASAPAAAPPPRVAEAPAAAPVQARVAPGFAYAPTDVAPSQRPPAGLPSTVSSPAVSSPSPLGSRGDESTDSSAMDVVLPTRRVPWLAIGIVTMLVLGSISGVALVRHFSHTAVEPAPARVDAAAPADEVPDVSTRDPATRGAAFDTPSGTGPAAVPSGGAAPVAPTPPPETRAAPVVPAAVPATPPPSAAPSTTTPAASPEPATASPATASANAGHTTPRPPHEATNAASTPSTSREPAAPTPTSLVRDARAAFRSGDARRCVELATEALGNGADATAYRVRGDCYRALGDSGHALRSYQRFCELAPTSGAIEDVRRIVEGMGGTCP
ncbi:MAG: serine/threonine-protein kinase [Polyangiales bacterium]